jgi:hypothetical protein
MLGMNNQARYDRLILVGRRYGSRSGKVYFDMPFQKAKECAREYNNHFIVSVLLGLSRRSVISRVVGEYKTTAKELKNNYGKRTRVIEEPSLKKLAGV